MGFSKVAGLMAVSLLMAGGASAQQESTNRVATNTDWSVFVEENPKQCWAVSRQKESLNTRDGRVVAVRRGDILLFVHHIPAQKVAGQVSFTGGYPFASGSTVTVTISGNSFEMATEGEWAWPATPADDVKIVAAMKRGAQAVLTARSSRGTITKDTFSLSGFTAAVDDAAKRCAG